MLQVNEAGIWLSLDTVDVSRVERLIAECVPVHVTVRCDDGDILFHSLPLAIDSGFLADKQRVTALQLARPDRYSASQRRKTFRVPLDPQDGVTIRLWRINEYVLIRDRPLPSQELRCDARDLGEGGFRAEVFPNSHEALNLKFNQRFRAEIRHGRNEMLFEARLRHPEQTQRDDESAVCGFEFIHNDRDVDARRHRQKLQQVMSEVQRAGFRRDAE